MIDQDFQEIEKRIYKSKILVVDDSPLNRELIKSYLTSVGFHNIAFAENGRQALDIIFGDSPDFVILDIIMPEVDGFEVLEKVRKDRRFDNLPIFVQTALNQEERLKVFNCGATGLLMKPINQAELLSSLKAHLQTGVLIKDLKSYSQRVSKDLDLAKSMQIDLLPNAHTLDFIEKKMGILIHSEFVTSDELGGDLWGVEPISDSLLSVYVLDFSGHGIMAALNTFRLSSFLKQVLQTTKSPSACLEKINKYLFDNLPTGQFATMFLGIVDLEEGKISYASASAPPPFIVNHETLEVLSGNGEGFPLGIVENGGYEDREMAFNTGSRLFLYSDGMSESCDHKGNMFDDEGIQNFLESNISEKRFFESVMRDFRVRKGNAGTEDDLTVVSLKRNA